jgi:uncharacterized membrane protein YccC
MSRPVLELLTAIRNEASELTVSGPRGRLALYAALAVGIATVLALALRLQNPWWAGISAFLATQASQPQSLHKGILRIVGSAAGAGIAFGLTPLMAYDQAATLLFLFTAGTLTILGFTVSRYGYAWLLGGITTVIVALGALDDPTQALNLAFYRMAEVVVGCVAALLVAQVLAEPGTLGGADAPGWRSLLGRNWYVLPHAARTGAMIASVPVVWRVLELPDLTQMAISVGAVMAVPTLTGEADRDVAAVARRTLQRVAGCALGGGAGIVLLALPLTQMFLPWLLLLMAGAAVGIQVQTGRHGADVVGVQAAAAWILTLVQGAMPPDSLVPAVARLAGILGAIGLLLCSLLLIQPSVARASG